MRKKLKKVLSMLLAIMVLSTSLGLESVRAEEGTDISTSEETSQETSQESNPETELEYDRDENTESKDIIENKASALNYFYVESPYLETPGTQNIVLSWGDGSEDVSDMRLVVTRDDGNIEEWNADIWQGQLYLFTREYADDTSTGIYTVNSFKYFLNGEEKEEILTEKEEEVVFGVNEEYDGYDPKQSVLEDEATSLEETIETSVLTINEDGSVGGQESIAAALEAVEAPTADIATFGSGMRERASEIVVALDAGHDSIDAGAQGNGLREEELTLKIANYCKAELETYPGVRVHMTRTGAGCPVGVTSWPHAGACIKERVRRASEAGAQIFVSMHLNSSVSSAAKGAEIIIPNNNWKPELGNQGRALAEKILSELVSLGLTNRGVYYKNSDDGSTYDDGSVSDYFSVQNWAKEYGLPGIIVEHAFISNGGGKDAELLKSEAGLRSLGVADAVGIANYLGLIKGGEWRTENGKTYFYINGNKVYGELRIGNGWYYFDEKTGEMATGWTKHHGNQYYYDEYGCMVYGEKRIDDNWYYFHEITGVMQTGWVRHHNYQYYYDNTGKMLYKWQNIDGNDYYFDPITGIMKTGFVLRDSKTYYYEDKAAGICLGEKRVGDKWYYFDEITGAMQTGWVRHHNHQYYYESNGVMVHGEKLIDENWYYFHEELGILQTGWVRHHNHQYYYDNTGKMLYKWQNIDGNDYYFDPITGIMKTGFVLRDNKTYYYEDKAAGICLGEKRVGDKWYYFDEITGAMQTGWVRHHNHQYYYESNGVMVHGEKLIDENWYYFHEELGVMQTGWSQHHGNTYYYSIEGKMQYGTQNIAGKYYYFDEITGILTDKVLYLGEMLIDGYWYYFDEKTGEMATGWSKHHGNTYYYSSEGKMQYGEQRISDKWYYFDEITGVMQTGWVRHHNHQYYYDNTGEMLYNWQNIAGKYYYFDKVTGVMKTGFVSKDSKIYYYEDKADGMCLGEKLIDGYWYYFDEKTGEMATGWSKHHGNTYYYSSEGKMQYGEQRISDKWYYFDEITGGMATGWTQHHGNVYYYSSKGEMLYGYQTIEGIRYYFNEITGVLEGETPILGVSDRNVVNQMVKMFQANSTKEYPSKELGKGGAPSIESLCQIFYEESMDEGIRPEVAFCQSMIETGWLKFNGSVSIDKFNFAGLGAVDDNPVEGSNSFRDVRTGIRAQIQHLKAYAVSGITENNLAHPCEDKRFRYVKKGSAPFVEMLGGKWASDKTYGYKIVTMMEKLKKY